MEYDEFQRRFVARIVEVAGKVCLEGGPNSVALQSAKAVWEANLDDERDYPEQAADNEMGYWE